MTHPMLTWIEAQLAEDERIARAAGWKSPHWDEDDIDSLESEAAQHIALHDPAAVLALIATHRAILFYHSGNHECSGPHDNCMWIDDDVCPTVRALVSAFAGRPGYESSWGPT